MLAGIETTGSTARLARWLDHLSWRLPRAAGSLLAGAVILSGIAYGVVRGEHVPTVLQALADARDGLANQAGFRVRQIAISGNTHMSREEILATAGVTGSSSLIFLDVETVRARLKSAPWIADATVLKLYPGELQIGIKEREAFALWQKDGRVSVIAADGTVLEPFVSPELMKLPLVVGAGAERRAQDFLALLANYPSLREIVRASVLVAERRWNLRLRNGIDVRLPERGLEAALDRLVALDRDKNLITRDIVAIDLRLADRVNVQLSERAAELRTGSLKDAKPAKKGREL